MICRSYFIVLIYGSVYITHENLYTLLFGWVYGLFRVLDDRAMGSRTGKRVRIAWELDI